ncbi:unnamed protein product [Cuscuta epithymum]|uniref:Uncharacterized protein n=1 Tax=Cuscuta epithymum TaxID=186058 RepID=A0AAV0F2U5_9ASTE|nr:unnamed protein product [Cuscuta epithymum]
MNELLDIYFLDLLRRFLDQCRSSSKISGSIFFQPKNQMLNFARKTYPHLRSSASSSLTVIIKLFVTKAGNVSSIGAEKDSFVVSYLVDRCGFSPEKALSASNYITFNTPDKPESVLSFLKNHGFTETQISEVVRRSPQVLLCNPQKILLPKIEFFKSLGFTVEDYTTMLCGCPSIFRRSLENNLFPTIHFLKQFLPSPEKLKVSLKRSPWIFSISTQGIMQYNIHILKEMKVPESKIAHYLHHQPRLFIKDKDKFVKILEEIKGMGFDPSRRTFMVAVHVFCSMSKSTWEKKVQAYKNWELSEDQIIEAFVRNPWIMACSEEKILQGMGFLVNKMGFKSSDILKSPVMFMLSLEKRIIPRSFVYQTLAAEGLLTEDLKLLSRMLVASEEKFLSKFVKCYESKVPDLLKLYQMSGGIP